MHKYINTAQYPLARRGGICPFTRAAFGFTSGLAAGFFLLKSWLQRILAGLFGLGMGIGLFLLQKNMAAAKSVEVDKEAEQAKFDKAHQERQDIIGELGLIGSYLKM